MQLRLALYSDQEIPENAQVDEQMLKLVGVARPRIGYVASQPDPSRFYYDRKRAYYKALGATLAPYVDANTSPEDPSVTELLNCDAIHLSGGNTFTFLAWLRQRGLSERLRNFALSGRVLIGVSAGAILLTPSVITAQLCGDELDSSLNDHCALRLAPFHFWPHYNPELGISPEISAVISRTSPIYACPDGSGILITGNKMDFVGHVTAFALSADPNA